MQRSIAILLATCLAAPALAQTAPAPAAVTDPALPAAQLAVEVAEPAPAAATPAPLTPLEQEACRRLLAEAQQATEAALAPPAPPAQPEKKPMSRAEGAGAVTGSVVGQVAGAAVAGPVGAAVGALVVGKVGQKVVNVVSGGDKKKDAEAAAKVDPVDLTIPGPPPELLSECQARSPS